MIINSYNDSTIWYHSTPQNRVDRILSDGLKPYSQPNDGNPRFPWIYLSQKPLYLHNDDIALLEVDLCDMPEEDVGFPFLDDYRWEIRVFVEIPPKYIKLVDKRYILA